LNTDGDLDEEGAKNLLNQIMKIWIEPAIVEKIKNEKLDSFKIPNIMAVTFPHQQKVKPKVLFGSECGSTQILAKYVGKQSKKIGEPVIQEEIEKPLEIMELPTKINPNDGYILLLGHKNQWNIIFNFQAQSAIVKNKLDRVIHFLDITEDALKKCNIFAFIDNLYASAELLAEIMILIVETGHITIPRLHPEKFKIFEDRVNKQKITGGDFIHAYERLLEIKNKARYGDLQLEINLKQLKNDYHIVKITLEAIEPKAIAYSKFDGRLVK
jgi:hypothetical protein